MYIHMYKNASYPKIARPVSCENSLAHSRASRQTVIVPLNDGGKKMVGAVLSPSISRPLEWLERFTFADMIQVPTAPIAPW